jgi:hypothetical protein
LFAELINTPARQTCQPKETPNKGQIACSARNRRIDIPPKLIFKSATFQALL